MTEVRKRGSPHRHQVVVVKLDDDTQAFIERLVGSSKTLNKILTTVQDIRRIVMATQAEIDAITEQLEAVKTQVGKIGTDLADFIADNPTITVEALQAKAAEVATALQALDDTLPEATP